MGYWLPHTATLDWCEGNYAITRYVVEFYNCLSSLLFPVLAVYAGGASWCRGPLAGRFVVAYVSLAVVGVGSALFHGTLQYHWQLMDELPMIYGAAQQVYCMTPNRLVLAILVTICSSFTYSYVFVHRNAVIHELLFAGLELAFVIAYLARLPKLHEKRRREAQKLLAGGVLFNILGAVFWILDNNICRQLILGKQLLGNTLSVFLEFHAWWHILSSLGVLWLLSGGIVLSYECDSVPVVVEYHAYVLPVLHVGHMKR
jgi:dihydroceramidase